MKLLNVLYYIVKNYIVQRNIFLIGIREFSNDLPINELTLLFGNEILNAEKNTKIFLQVQKFIQDTGLSALRISLPNNKVSSFIGKSLLISRIPIRKIFLCTI
jgi:hypothetical protein